MKLRKVFALLLAMVMTMGLFTGAVAAEEEKSDSFIADRTIRGLIFQSAGDASVEMNEEILAYIKEKTGITLELEGITSESSSQALAAGLAAGDLPDFIAFYLNHSGRKEMPMLLKAANEGMFHDLMPFFQEAETYGKYLEEGFLPEDTYNNIMFREDWDGASYLVHMAIDRKPAQINGTPIYGGLYIRKDIAEDMGINPMDIRTSEELIELCKKIQEKGYKDDNGKDITVIGPTAWGGHDRDYLLNDLIWTGPSGEKFWKDEDGKIKHEAQTEYGLKRVEVVQELLKSGIMHPEYFTMEETRAREGLVNGSFAIISDMHSGMTENRDLKYIPLGTINRVDGKNNRVMSYKSGYAGWAIPSTTENPEEVFKFADWLASREGKMLYLYGLEGRDYELDENGNPLVKQEVLDLIEENPEEAKKLGFRGVRSFWGEHLAWTDLDNEEDFGEANYGDNVREDEEGTVLEEVLKMVNFDKQVEEQDIVDGMTPKAFLFAFDEGEGSLETALERYNEDIVRAYFADDLDAAKAILDESLDNLLKKGLEEFTEFLLEREEAGDSIRY